MNRAHPSRRRRWRLRRAAAAIATLAGAAGLAAVLMAPGSGAARAVGGHGTERMAVVRRGQGPAATLPPARFSPADPPKAWPGPLPYPVLIADSQNARMLEVAPDKRILWQYPASGQAHSATGIPGDDAFFSPDGTSIVTNDEDAGTIVRVSYYTRKIVWHFGVSGVLGGGSRLLNYPDDAYLLPDGNTIVADIRNCRELTISPAMRIVRQLGIAQSGYCQTNPASGLYGYPNGDAPQPNGNILMTFISGNVIALVRPTGQVIWQCVAPDLYGGYVSDAQLLHDGNVLVASYGKPGSIVIFDPHTGAVVWRYYVTSGSGELNHPSLALMLPNGNVLLNDDRDDRVIVIDPHTNRIVWQYGHTGVAGSGAGYLNTPDGVDVDYFRDWQGWLATHPSRPGFGPATRAA